MTNKTLEQLYAEHVGKVSLKWFCYLAEYDRILDDYRSRRICLLELGVQNGGSLEIWGKYFPNARMLLGCDIDHNCACLAYEDTRIALVVGDANSDAAQAAILEHADILDVIIDDGSHRSSDIVNSFIRYFPRLADGGVYIVEDLHCSYWQEFEGGLFDPFSSVAFFKRLIDIINYEHWGIEKNRTDILSGFFAEYGFHMDEEVLKNIHSIEFINSMCVIRKDIPGRNSLGPLFVGGSVELVAPGHMDMHLRQKLELKQTTNEWSVGNMWSEGELLVCLQKLRERDGQISNLNQAVAERDGQISNLNQAVAERDGQIMEIFSSTAWRITKPIRFVGRIFRKCIG